MNMRKCLLSLIAPLHWHEEWLLAFMYQFWANGNVILTGLIYFYLRVISAFNRFFLILNVFHIPITAESDHQDRLCTPVQCLLLAFPWDCWGGFKVGIPAGITILTSSSPPELLEPSPCLYRTGPSHHVWDDRLIKSYQSCPATRIVLRQNCTIKDSSFFLFFRSYVQLELFFLRHLRKKLLK